MSTQKIVAMSTEKQLCMCVMKHNTMEKQQDVEGQIWRDKLSGNRRRDFSRLSYEGGREFSVCEDCRTSGKLIRRQ